MERRELDHDRELQKEEQVRWTRSKAPLSYQRRGRWSKIMRSTIAFNASFFNTHRMVQQYTANAYV